MQIMATQEQLQLCKLQCNDHYCNNTSLREHGIYARSEKLLKMSSRDKSRESAKRLLVFFKGDKSTCILGSKFVKRVKDGSNKLADGAQVMVDYEGKEYQAVILKLHGRLF